MWRFAWQNLITRPTRTGLAVLGLTIPIIAILGLFSLTNGIRDSMGNTLERMNGLMVMRENSPAPVLSDLPATMADDLRKIQGTRIVAPEVWKLAPQIEGRSAGAGRRLRFSLPRATTGSAHLPRRSWSRECSFQSISI